MTIFVYGPSHPTNHNVASLEVLNEALVLNGVTDASTTLGVDVTIDTATGTQANCDLAVIQADKTGLLHAQTIKIKEIIGNSPDLLDVGFSATVGAKAAQFSLNRHESDYGYYEGLLAKCTRTPGFMPFQLISTDRQVINITVIGRATVLANQAANRVKYIYFDQTNADLSLGEAGYVILIRAAPNVAAVNAILDSRV